jgi:hypothetical protein
MDWKELLKVDLEEARRLTARHAPEEIEGFTPLTPQQARKKNRLELNWNSWKHVLSEDEQKAGNYILDMMSKRPKDFDKFADSFQLMFREHIVRNPPPKTTSLVDRAKEMNRKHPRMGSGRK